MAYRNKTYVAFDADQDMAYYRMFQAWNENDRFDFEFNNAHEIHSIRPTSQDETIYRNLRERLKNSKLFILLIGKDTKNLHKFVRWEIDQAIGFNLPIICANINKTRGFDSALCPAILRDKLALHISYGPKIIEYAMRNWPEEYYMLKKRNVAEPREYSEKVYFNCEQN